MDAKITTEDRIKDMQIDLKHMKGRVDLITFYIQKINKDGLKIKVIK